MYCVKCGVRLQENTKRCPLCHTPVWNPDGDAQGNLSSSGYPDTMPVKAKRDRRPAVIILTALCAFIVVVETVLCLILYGRLNWSGFVTGGIFLTYILVLLPFWFKKPRAEILVPIDHIAVAIFLIYACRKTGGHWFWTFALPIVIATCLISTVMICLLKYVKGRRAFIFGGFFLVLSGFSILVEYLEHITFKTEMFLWSWFPFVGLAALGILLILAGIIPPFRRALEKYFFF